MADPVLGPVAVENLLKVTFFQKLYGQQVLNTLWYEVTAVPGTPVDRWVVMGELADTITGTVSILTDMKSLQVAALNHDAVRVSVYINVLDRFPYYEIAVNDPGVRTGNAKTANIAMSIEKRAANFADHPRKGIGRMQLAGLPVEEISAGFWGATILDDANALCQDITNDVVTTSGCTLTPSLVTWGPSSYTAHPIFGCAAKDTVRDMSRRTVGRGK